SRGASGQNRLWKAPQKHVAAQARPVDKRLSSGADRLEAAKPKLQRSGKLRALRLGVFPSLRKQEPRLQICQPSRHDEIIRREFDPQITRGRDIFEILLDERKKGNVAQIHFLAARKVKQEIERAFESGDVDHEGAVLARVLCPAV